MTPGPTLILACPHCGTAHSKETFGSVNTLGAKFWSDGWIDARMWPATVRISRCSSCARVFWLDDATQLGQLEDPFYAHIRAGSEGAPLQQDPRTEAWRRAPRIGRSDEDVKTLLEALAEVDASATDRIRHLRMRLWHRLNDARRDGAMPADQEHQEFFRPNLDALGALLDDSDANDRLLKGEVSRELGEFGSALALLEAPFEGAMQRAADQIRKHAQRHHAEVFVLDTPSDDDLPARVDPQRAKEQLTALLAQFKKE